MDWLTIAGLSAAGGIGGMIYWAIAERELILARAKALLRQR
ncbi:MAG: hypothetical protein AB7T59_09040 [Hyphomonadaceae bacterium]